MEDRTKICRDDDLPSFWPHDLGQRCPTFDFLVEPMERASKGKGSEWGPVVNW